MIDIVAEIESRMDAQAFDYLREIDDLRVQYERDGRAIRARFDAVKLECESKMETAKSELWQAARDLNAEYRKRAALIAGTHMEQAAHPEDIDAARKRLDASIGGCCHDSISFNKDDARAAIHSAVEKRRQHEEYEATEERRRARMPKFVIL